MIDIIEKQLSELEKKENIQILFAVESGSRAWGFASPDSDFDVRFVYKRPAQEYIKLEKRRDVVEYILNDELDINGWDIDKALKLLHTSNPTFMEWCNSPIVYRHTEFLDKINSIKNKYFYTKAGIYHYLSMAGGNFREYLKAEEVKLKKYFYVIRPLLACQWILKNNTPPPMLFSDLLLLLPDNLKQSVDLLLENKIKYPEITAGKRIDTINDWIEEELLRLNTLVKSLPSDKKADWAELNCIMLKELGI